MGVFILKKFAYQLNLIAIPNKSSLHQTATPQGGGVVVGIVFLVFCIYYYLSGDLKNVEFLVLFGGCLIMSITGFLDDIININPIKRFFIQILAASWGLYWIGGIPYSPIFNQVSGLYTFVNIVSIVVIVWFINAFNFMDGIDGMSTSGATFFSLTIGGYFFWHGIEPLGSLLIILAVSSFVFLYFNWPPAKMFLGDAGSYFYGYLFAFLFLITIKNDYMSIWTWLIIFAYFITDTTTTTFLRILLVKDWYRTHHSHAYQNLARVLNNHKFVTVLVLIINIFYLLPLAYISIQYQEYGWLAFFASVTPIFFFVLKYGPLYDR